MPTYEVTDPDTGVTYEIHFEGEPTQQELNNAASHVFRENRPETFFESLGGTLASSIDTLLMYDSKEGFTSPAYEKGGAWMYDAMGATHYAQSKLYRAMGLDSLADAYEMGGATLTDIGREGLTAGKRHGKAVRERYPKHQFASRMTEMAAGLSPTLIAAPAAGWAGLGYGGQLLATMGAAGAQSGGQYMQEARIEYMGRLQENWDSKWGPMTQTDLELRAIGQAAPWALLSGAKTAALTGLFGYAGGRLTGSGGPEMAGMMTARAGGVSSRAADRARRLYASRGGGMDWKPPMALPKARWTDEAALEAGAFARKSSDYLGKRGVVRGTARTGVQAGLEGIEEGIDEAVQAGIDYYTIKEDMTFDQAKDRVIDAIAAGALFGGAIEVAARPDTMASIEAEAAIHMAGIHPIVENALARRSAHGIESARKLRAMQPRPGETALERKLRWDIDEEPTEPIPAFLDGLKRAAERSSDVPPRLRDTRIESVEDERAAEADEKAEAVGMVKALEKEAALKAIRAVDEFGTGNLLEMSQTIEGRRQIAELGLLPLGGIRAETEAAPGAVIPPEGRETEGLAFPEAAIEEPPPKPSTLESKEMEADVLKGPKREGLVPERIAKSNQLFGLQLAEPGVVTGPTAVASAGEAVARPDIPSKQADLGEVLPGEGMHLPHGVRGPQRESIRGVRGVLTQEQARVLDKDERGGLLSAREVSIRKVAEGKLEAEMNRILDIPEEAAKPSRKKGKLTPDEVKAKKRSENRLINEINRALNLTKAESTALAKDEANQILTKAEIDAKDRARQILSKSRKGIKDLSRAEKRALKKAVGGKLLTGEEAKTASAAKKGIISKLKALKKKIGKGRRGDIGGMGMQSFIQIGGKAMVEAGLAAGIAAAETSVNAAVILRKALDAAKKSNPKAFAEVDIDEIKSYLSDKIADSLQAEANVLDELGKLEDSEVTKKSTKKLQEKLRAYSAAHKGARKNMLAIPELAGETGDKIVASTMESINAGRTVTDAIDTAYESVKDTVDKPGFRDYMMLRLNETLNQMSGGISFGDAVLNSGEPLSGKTTLEIDMDRAEVELNKKRDIPPPARGMANMKNWLTTMKRFFIGSSDVVAGNAAMLGLAARMEAHVDLHDKWTGELSALFLEGGEGKAYIDADSAWGAWFGVKSKAAEAADIEFAAYQEGMYTGKPVDTSGFSPLGKRLIEGWKKLAVVTGNAMKAEGIMVKYPDGSKRPFKMIGEDFWGRWMKPEYTRALNAMDADSVMNDTLQKIIDSLAKMPNELRSHDVKGLLIWWNKEKGGRGKKKDASGKTVFQGNNESEAFLASIDRARTGKKLPAELMDFSVDSGRRYIFNWSERMAQIQAYGQKARDKTDLWEDVINNLNLPQHSYSDEALYIEGLRKAAYGITDTNLGRIGKWSLLLNKVATLTMLTGGFNAMRNLTGIGVTTAIFGGVNSAKAFGKMRDYAAAAKQSRSWGVIQDNTALLLAGHDVALEGAGVTDLIDRGLSVGTKWGLKGSGFTHSENYVRTHAAFTASVFASEGVGAIKNKDNDKLAGEFKRMAERLGVDADAIVAEDSPQGVETSKFIRKAVKEVQGGYRFNQLPAFMNNPAGKFIFKFGAYGMQVSRAIRRNVVGEAKAGNFTPLLRLMATVAGSGEMLYWLRETLFGKAIPHASLKEIMFGENRTSKLFQRLLNDVFYAGTLGIIGDLAAIPRNFYTKQRVRNPTDPAGLQIIENIGYYIYDRVSEGTLITPEAFWGFLESQFSAVRYGKGLVTNLASKGGREWDFVLAERAKQDQIFLRNTTRRFQEAVGDDVKNLIAPAIYAPTPYSRFYDRVKERLRVGDTPGAIEAAREVAEQMPPDERAGAWQRLSASIMRSQPMKVGDSTSKVVKQEFISWARRNMAPDDVKRIMDLQRRYMQTYEHLRDAMKPRQSERHYRRHGKRMDALGYEKKYLKELESVFGY